MDDYCGWYCEDREIDTDKFIESGVLNINGTEALWYLYLADELIGDHLLDKTILIAKENYAFRLHLISNASEYKSNEKEFLSVVNSFRF